ncbi:hypothetical protein ACFS2C_11990 [Prauserella oleivorans]|uniref:Uncharacterized protein n=1 Tax=Prauserella oleivorans TaxID=1478153 RepID=A0ABW5W845_9PSEU
MHPQQSAVPGKVNKVSAGTASDVKTLVAAALMTFAAGMLVLIGYLMVGVFGGILAIIGAVLAIGWWSGIHGKVFPRDLPGKSLAGLTAVAGVLFLLAYAMS